MRRCGICGGLLDVPGDDGTRDCGGDCLRCMAEAGDPDCVSATEEVPSRVADTATATTSKRG
jgi:hypothetical protein